MPQAPRSRRGDADGSGKRDLPDAIFTLQFLFMGGEVPKPPGPEACGEDPTEDDFAAFEYPGC